MSTQPKIGIENNSPEEVAFKLLRLIQEGMPNQIRAKDAILNLYAECLLAVQSPQSRPQLHAAEEKAPKGD